MAGAVLAGGRGTRLGGGKATALLAGRPLISYPLEAMAAAGIDAFVVAKPDTGLPPLGGVEVVLEPAEPSHPLAGIVAALRHAGRPVVVLACDMPLASPALLAALAGVRAPAAGIVLGRARGAERPPCAEAPPQFAIFPEEPLVVPAPGGRPEPLQARWSPVHLPALEAALAREEPLRRTVAGLSPRLLDDAELARFGDPARMFLNVNDDADLRRAEAALA